MSAAPRRLAAPSGLTLAALAALAGLSACAAPDGADSAEARLAADLERSAAMIRAAQAGSNPWQAPPRPAAAPEMPPGMAPGMASSDLGPERLGPVQHAALRAGPIREARGLIGATPAALVRALGQPDLRRTEGEAETWLYRGQTCMLDVVLYPDAPPGRDRRVAFAAARAAGIERVPESACLAEIGRAHQLVARTAE